MTDSNKNELLDDDGDDDKKESQNPLEVSDDAFADMEFPFEEPDSSEKKNDEADKKDDDLGEGKSDDDEGSDDSSSSDDSTTNSDDDKVNKENGDPEKKDEDDTSNADPGEKNVNDESAEKKVKKVDKKVNTDSDSDKKKKKKSDDVNDKPSEAQAQLDELFKPFRANGKEIKIDNIKDVITLMQQGANYNKKMAGLKPNLKLMKMLSNNKLLDESKLAFLIDLDKKDPAAIAKLLKDSGINPLDMDVEKTAEYQPKSYTVDDKEVELDDVLDTIKDSPSYKDTLDVISNKWDESSKRVLVENPSVITVINEHIANGVYAEIMAIVDKDRMLGKHKGLSDIEAYKQVGTELKQANDANIASNANAETATKVARKTDDSKLKSRKKATSTTKSTTSKKMKSDFNPLSMSDEEIDKMTSSGMY